MWGGVAQPVLAGCGAERLVPIYDRKASADAAFVTTYPMVPQQLSEQSLERYILTLTL